MLEIILGGVLPPYDVYPTHVNTPPIFEASHYSLFHLIGNGKESWRYDKMEFKIMEKTKAVGVIGKGEVKDKVEFDQILETIRQKHPLATFHFEEVVFDVDFDVVWGKPFEILFSEKIVEKIRHIPGLQISGFNDYHIIAF